MTTLFAVVRNVHRLRNITTDLNGLAAIIPLASDKNLHINPKRVYIAESCKKQALSRAIKSAKPEFIPFFYLSGSWRGTDSLFIYHSCIFYMSGIFFVIFFSFGSE